MKLSNAMESTAFLICLTNVLIVANVNCKAVRRIFLFDNVANVNCEAVCRNFFYLTIILIVTNVKLRLSATSESTAFLIYLTIILIVANVKLRSCLLHFFLFDDRSYCYKCKIAAVCCIGIHHIFDLFDECKIAVRRILTYFTVILL